MLMYNLFEYSDNFSKTSESLWQCCRDETNNKKMDLNHLNLNKTL